MQPVNNYIHSNTEPVTLEAAVTILTSRVNPVKERERVPLGDACGRMLAEDITAVYDQPPFPRSPLDGYAVRATDTVGASEDDPTVLRVVTEIDAGSYYDGTIEAGCAVRIMTGAPIPDGCDAVIGQEDTDYGEEQVSIYREMTPYQNYCEQGEDYHAGALLLSDREYIGPAETGIIASTGLDQVFVYRRPRAMIISTGDELMMPGQVLSQGKIYDSNLFIVAAQLGCWEVDVASIMHVNDDAEECAELINSNIESVDLIITTGGVSVGKRDIMHEVYRALDVERLFWKVKIKPGMAMLAGSYRDKLILSLSGNPYAAYADLHLLVRPVIAALNGNEHPSVNMTTAVISDDYPKSSPTRRFLRSVVRNGAAHIEGHTGGNGVVSSGRGVNALIDIEAGSGPLHAGDTVSVIML